MSTHTPWLVLSLSCAIILAAGDPQIELDDYIPFYLSGLKDEFDLKLLKNLDSHGNSIVSPISLKLVLALLYEGSSGSTEVEIRRALKFSDNKTAVRQEFSKVISSLQDSQKSGCGDYYKYPDQTDTYTLNLGTRIFLDERTKPVQSYQAKACEIYQTKIEPMDFANAQLASDKINTWVQGLTFGKIKKLVGPDEVDNAVLLIANAIYFKGFWRQQFLRNQSHYGGFYVTPNEVVQVPYMATSGVYFYLESKELDAKILRIPYKGKKFSLIIVMPNAKAGLSKLINSLTMATLRNSINIMDKTTIDLIMPKFRFDNNIKLASILKKMGMVSMFVDSASLAGITRDEGQRLIVSDVVQKSGIEVNEEGSEAFAATDIQITNKFGESQTSFNVTHPFMFFIEDQTTQTVLFVGKVENPLQAADVPVPPRFGEAVVSQEGPVLPRRNQTMSDVWLG